ncbi:MAG: ABC transporter ATP-binding protein [Lachnospiraceae bacterium]|nr:ABC transporter ATP-binding protein [Lachnospiraceae bacterium]
MIEIKNLEKSFADIKAVNHISLSIREEEVFGLVGTNGAGKSTLLRMLAGVLKPDQGQILVDGKEVWDNPEAKGLFYFIPDDPYFFPNANAAETEKYMESVYPHFQAERFDKLTKDFGLDRKRRISNYSKGMKRQLAILLGLCAATKYLFLDETFDGLDPVMRQGVKSLFAEDMSERGLTPVISSHNLRELEDICDHVGLLHKGGLLLSEDLVDMKLGVSKIQCVFENENDAGAVLSTLRILNHETRGRLHTLVVRGEANDIKAKFANTSMVFFEILPLTLEELFISETEVAGYDIKKLILG